MDTAERTPRVGDQLYYPKGDFFVRICVLNIPDPYFINRDDLRMIICQGDNKSMFLVYHSQVVWNDGSWEFRLPEKKFPLMNEIAVDIARVV